MRNMINLNHLSMFESFLNRNGLSKRSSVVEVYHAVRNISYCSDGNRTVQSVVNLNRGSCSGKHLLLRDLLCHLNHSAIIETVQGDFAAAIPIVDSMSDELKTICRNGGVKDFHHYVVLKNPDCELNLDATWPDNLIELGFKGNQKWQGNKNTIIALSAEKTLKRVEDISAYKTQLINELSNAERKYRERFLLLLTEWVRGITKMGEIK